MPIISFICLLIFLILLISGLKKNADFLSPGRIFGMLWAVIIGLVEFKFSHWQFEWTSFGWFIALLGLITLLIGTYISYIINFNKPFIHVRDIRTIIKLKGVNENKLFYFIIIFFLICLFCLIAEWQIEGYVPLFTVQPDKARLKFGVFGLHYIVNSINVVLFLIIQYFIFVNSNKKKKFFLAFIFIISVSFHILLVQRYSFFILIMLGFCLFYYSGRKIRLRTVLILVSLVIVLILGVQSIRTTQLVRSYIIIESKIKFSSQYTEFAIPYMYLTMNLENVVKYYSHIENHSFGFFSTEVLNHLAGIKFFIAEYFNFDKYKLHIGGYNTFPFYWTYYYDFGITGLALFPFIIGFVISEIYYYLHRNPNNVVLAVYTIAFAIITNSYNSDPITRLDTMLPFLIIVFSQFFIKKVSDA
ncbi:MAG TPA: O-antigen polymerase [Ignavibacteriaceae bacterium]|nr:O-antigen polymerase [Ignavibacteriaceae bacterium]